MKTLTINLTAGVSILTRAEARVLRIHSATALRSNLFQSSPAPRRGCCAFILHAP